MYAYDISYDIAFFFFFFFLHARFSTLQQDTILDPFLLSRALRTLIYTSVRILLICLCWSQRVLLVSARNCGAADRCRESPRVNDRAAASATIDLTGGAMEMGKWRDAMR